MISTNDIKTRTEHTNIIRENGKKSMISIMIMWAGQ